MGYSLLTFFLVKIGQFWLQIWTQRIILHKQANFHADRTRNKKVGRHLGLPFSVNNSWTSGDIKKRIRYFCSARKTTQECVIKNGGYILYLVSLFSLSGSDFGALIFTFSWITRERFEIFRFCLQIWTQRIILHTSKSKFRQIGEKKKILYTVRDIEPGCLGVFKISKK